MAIRFQEKSGNVEVATKTIVTLDYPEINDKPIINDVELVGSLSLDELGIQEKGNYALAEDIPTKTSQLTNDSNYINKHQDISHLATKTEVNSKANKEHKHNEYLTEHQDLSSYAKKSDLHTHSNKNVLDTITQNDIEKWNNSGGGGSDVDLSNYYTKTEIDNKKYITNSITTDFNVGKSIYLNTVGSSVNTNSNSKLVFGTVDNVSSWITSNTSGAFAFSKGSGNITIYPKTSQYNCIMSDCDSDLGRTDKPWKNIYFNGVLSNGSTSIAMNKIANKDNYYTKAEIDAMLVNGDEVSY